MSEQAPQPTLEDVAAAMEAADGRTPSAVIDAFLPKPVTRLGQKLLPLSAGHELLLAQLGHPLANGRPWENEDVLLALFLFSRPSRESFAMIADDVFEARFFEFLDTIPATDIPNLGPDMVAHWLKARKTALAMENPHSSAQKKTPVSAGGSIRSAVFARPMATLRTWLSTTFRSAKSSR